MAIYENSIRQIEISGFITASCDLCQVLRVSEDAVFTVSKSSDQSQWNRYEIQNSSGLSNSFRAELNRTGWTQEVFHGKLMILCPKCSGL